MSSAEELVPEEPVEQVEEKTEFVRRRLPIKRPSNVVKSMSVEEREMAMKQLPSSSLDVVPQPFDASKTPEIKGLIPGPAIVQPVKPKKEKPAQERRPLRMAAPTADYHPPDFSQDPRLQEMDPLFREYQQKEKEIVTHNPYATDQEIYMPQTRRRFYRFVEDNYQDFELIPEIKGPIDENACDKLGKGSVEAFLYQKFIREYIRTASPYRGVLVYHGLGSGKTCSAIAAAEALYGTTNKKIIVMTPFSLRNNFISEISFCGFRHFNLQNHWVAEEISVETDLTYLYARSVLSLSEDFLRKVMARPDGRNVIWIAKFDAPPNFESLSQNERNDIREQITQMVESRITFISYNGITAAKLKDIACNKRNFFDDAVIVIDEVHNLTRLMQGEVMPYMVNRKGRTRKIPAEPVVPGRWKPGLCGSPLNYKRAYLFYRLLTDARNSKIIGLSGTPIINFPEEVGILANVLSGYMECAEVTLLSAQKSDIEKFREIAEAEPRIDIVRFRPGDQRMGVLLSTFQEGYERVIDPEQPNTFVGVRYNPDAQAGIQEVFGRIKAKLLAERIPIEEEKYVSYPRLPIDDEEFHEVFIEKSDLSIKNKLVLQKRLTGLISYYQGSKEEYMPKVILDKIETCEMSDYVLSMYAVVRKEEIDGEAKKKKETGDVFAAVEMFSKMKNPSSYRFRSRALCNFAFPSSIERPFPGSEQEEEKEVGDVPEVGVEGVEDISEEERAEAVQAAAEDEMTVAPEAEVFVEEQIEEPLEQKLDDLPPLEQKGGKPVLAKKKLPEESVARRNVPRVSQARMIPYPERIKRAMTTLMEQRNLFLNLDDPNPAEPNPQRCLAQYSTKLDRMLRRIQSSNGSNLVYSQFKTVEGLGVLGIALTANGYTEIKIDGGDADPRFSQDTLASFAPRSQEQSNAELEQKTFNKRFILFTGEGSKDRRNLILNLFNGNFDKLPPAMRLVLEQAGLAERRNNDGEICWVIGITGAGAEGISLKCCRSVHIMEPYWNNVRLDQVKGRAIRICSHKDLPFAERNVEIYTYYTVFSEEQIKSDLLDMTIKTTDQNETSDEKVYKVSIKKDKINKEMLQVMKESAVDCGLNSADNDGVKCLVVNGKPDQYMFDPNLLEDILITASEFKTARKAKAVDAVNAMHAVEEEVRKVRIGVIQDKKTGESYLVRPQTGNLIFDVFAREDTKCRRPIGTIEVNPASGSLKGSDIMFM